MLWLLTTGLYTLTSLICGVLYDKGYYHIIILSSSVLAVGCAGLWLHLPILLQVSAILLVIFRFYLYVNYYYFPSKKNSKRRSLIQQWSFFLFPEIAHETQTFVTYYQLHSKIQGRDVAAVTWPTGSGFESLHRPYVFMSSENYVDYSFF